jgi:hypothetical protein
VEKGDKRQLHYFEKIAFEIAQREIFKVKGHYWRGYGCNEHARTPIKVHLTVQYCACGFVSGVVISNWCKLIFYKYGAYHLFTLGPSIITIAKDYTMNRQSHTFQSN